MKDFWNQKFEKTFPDMLWKEEFDGIVNLKEGKGHSGDAHVIRLIGTKK